MIASGMLNFRRCDALRLEDKRLESFLSVPPLRKPSGHTMLPCCTIVARLPASACPRRHRTLCTLLDRFYNHLSSSDMSINDLFINNGTTGA